MVILHLSISIVIFLILLAGLLVEIIASKVIQDLFLQLHALMADERLLFGMPGHAAVVLADSICNQVGLVAVEWCAIRHWLHLLGYRYE